MKIHTSKSFVRSALILSVFLGYSFGVPTLADDLSAQLPDMGSAGASLSPEDERVLGQEFMRAVTQRFTLIDDPLANRYLQNLGNRLISQLNGDARNISLFIIDDPSINAFAGPGGYIGVHTGLILAAQSEAELASVLAHEIAHVTQRHLVRQFEANKNQGLKTIGAMIAAVLLGNANPQVGDAIITSTIAGNVQQQLSYSRAHEQEADRIGLEILARADFDPRAMSNFFTTLQKSSSMSDNRIPEFSRTHPITTSRIADTQNRAALYPRTFAPDDRGFRITQHRIAANAKQKSRVLAAFQQRLLQESQAQEDLLYHDTLDALKRGDYPEARNALAKLLAKDPHRLHYHYTAAEIEIADKDLEKAQQILVDILKFYPGNISLTMLYAKTLLQNNQAAEAFKVLKETRNPGNADPALNTLYAEAAMKTGKKGEAYKSLAELSYFRGNLHQAIDYLEQALASASLTEYEKLSLESRLEMLKSEAVKN